MDSDTAAGPAGKAATKGGDPRAPSSRSLSGLDGVNFLMSDVQGGVGPYLSVFLAGSRGWESGPIGIAMAASSVAGALCQVPAGLLVDATRWKRLLIVLAALAVGLGCLLIVWFPGFWPVVMAQALLGTTSAILPRAVAALSLGIVGRRLMPARISRNEIFNHAGTFLAAVLAGALGHYLGKDWIFYLVCVFAVASAAVVTLIDPAEVDHRLARGGEDPDDVCKPVSILGLLGGRDVVVFVCSVILFHFGNAAMLPFAGQVLARAHPGSDTVALSACIISAQLVMVGVSWAVGRALTAGIGRKPIFLVALATLPVRGVLFSFTTSPYGIVAIQLLDGLASGIFGVLAIIIAADLTRGTGRFNLMQGVVALAVGVGASLSNVIGGYVVQGFGYPTGFLGLTGVALCALVFFLILMPETGQGGTHAQTAAAP